MLRISRRRMDPVKYQNLLSEGLRHLRLTFAVHRWQLSEVRHVLHEHPTTAWSWGVSFVRAVRALDKMIT
eukprot:3107273-Karenia_brevis.AAC.1